MLNIKYLLLFIHKQKSLGFHLIKIEKIILFLRLYKKNNVDSVFLVLCTEQFLTFSWEIFKAKKYTHGKNVKKNYYWVAPQKNLRERKVGGRRFTLRLKTKPVIFFELHVVKKYRFFTRGKKFSLCIFIVKYLRKIENRIIFYIQKYKWKKRGGREVESR